MLRECPEVGGSGRARMARLYAAPRSGRGSRGPPIPRRGLRSGRSNPLRRARPALSSGGDTARHQRRVRSPRLPGTPAASRRGHGHSMRVLVLRAAILVLGLLTWEIWARALNPLLYVPPSAVVPAVLRLVALESYPDLPSSLLLTLREIAIAYAMAIVAGIGVGAALGVNRILGRAYGPMLSALYAVPAVVWYPSLMLFFGLDAASKIAFGFLLGFFPITLAVLAGIRQVNPHLIAVAQAVGARPVATFVKVMVPAMMFTLVSGLRTGLALTVIGVIVGEILGSKAGMGALINHAYGLLRTADYVALVLVTLALVVASDALASLVEHRAQRWSDGLA